MFAALGLARIAGPLKPQLAGWAAASGAAGLGIAWSISSVTSTEPIARGADADTAQVFAKYVFPLLVAGVITVALAFLLRHLSRWVSSIQGHSVFLALCLATGMCALAPVAGAGTWLHTSSRAQAPNPQLIGPGGLQSARWLEEHSTPDDLVATDMHSLRPGRHDFRNFWLAGYAQRRILVEGWAYVPPESVGEPSNKITNLPTRPPFWDRAKLRLNDQVFSHPTAAGVARLHDKYGVDWLFADRREKPDLAGLARVAKQRFRAGGYTVYEIDDPPG